MIRLKNVASLYSALYYAVDYCKEHASEEINVIVPDKLSLFMEKFLFEHLNISSSFNLKVSTLNRFAKKTCCVAKENQISKVASILLIHKILNENINNLEIFKSKAYSFEYAENIYNTIQQLKASKISFEELNKFTSMNKQLSGKIKDLALVFEEYENGKAGLLDALDVFLMSSLSVADENVGANILFVGFDDFTAIEYSIIEQLAKVANVNIVSYYGKSGNKHIYNNEIYTQLQNMARVCEIDFKTDYDEPECSQLKNFLKENLFGLNKNSFVVSDVNEIRVCSAENMDREIEFVARSVRNEVLMGKSFKEFGVAVFDLENNISRIKEIFEKYELNYYVDSQLSINNSVFYKFLINILKYNLNGYELSSIIDLINSPFLDLADGVKRNFIVKLKRMNFRGEVNEQTDLGEDFDAEKRILVDFMNLMVLDKVESAEDCVSSLIKIFKGLNIERSLNDISNNATELQEKLLITKSYEVIQNLFQDILKIVPDAGVEDLFDILRNIGSVVKINNLPLTLDAIKVVDANNCSEIFENLYIVNCTAQNAPNLKFDCGIILDSEIEELNFAHKLSPTIAHINRLAKLRLFNLAMLFEKCLAISYSNSSSELIQEILTKIKIVVDRKERDLSLIEDIKTQTNIALSKWNFVELKCKNKEKINENIIKNKKIDKLSSKNLNIFTNLNKISASQLENYFKCPFYYFLGNILKIKPELKTEILALDIGNVLHEIIFKFYKRKKRVGDIYEFCQREIFNFVERDDRLKLNVDSPILISLIDEAVRVIQGLNYIDENSKFEPKYFEHEFANDSALKLKNIVVNGKVDRVDECDGMLRIVDYKSGQADASLKELFYGNKLQLFLYACAMEENFGKGVVGTFYLPLHNAYTRELGNTYSLKGFYLNEDFVVRSFDKRLEPGVKSDIVNARMTKEGKASKTKGYKELESNDLLRLKHYAKDVSETAVEEIRSGYIKPSPHEMSNQCKFCPYVQVCLRKSSCVEFRPMNKVDLTSFKEVDDAR